MKKPEYWVLLAIVCLLATTLAGCKEVTPVVLKASGQLRQISLSWTESKNAVGYNVYRRTGSTGSFVKLNGTPLVKTVYADTIPSPEGDGVIYHYYVAAIPKKGAEVPSNIVRSMHGTRPAGKMESEGNLSLGSSELSPYVVDPGSELLINAVTFIIPTDVTLYLLESSKLSMLAAGANYGYVFVFGTLRALGTAEDPVTITSHNADGGAPSEGTGFGLTIRSGVDQPVTSLQYARISNLNSNGLNTEACSPIIEQCHIEAYGNVYLTILDAGPQIRNCAMDHVYLRIRSMSAAFPSLEVKDNRFGELESYCVRFMYSNSSSLLEGQITNNSFASADPRVELNKITGTEAVKLGGNYWGRETAPSVYKENGTTADADFAPLLTAAPSNIGPSW